MSGEIDLGLFSDLSPEAIRRFAEHYRLLARALSARADWLERGSASTEADRERMRDWRQRQVLVWEGVEQKLGAGLSMNAAVEAVAGEMRLDQDAVRSAWYRVARQSGAKKREKRDAEIMRRRRAGLTPSAIAGAVGLHERTVRQIIQRRLAEMDEFPLPAASPSPRRRA